MTETVSPADAEHASAKAALLRMRIEKKQHKLVRRANVDALIDGIAGVTLTALSSLPARCAPRGDLAIRLGGKPRAAPADARSVIAAL